MPSLMTAGIVFEAEYLVVAGGGGGAANGGSGIVIVAYKTAYPSASIGAGLTFSYSTSSRTGYHVYQFTAGTGTMTFI